MKRYVLGLLLPLLLGPVVVAGLIYFDAGAPPNQNALIMQAKLDRARELKSPKIVLIGGSNVFFAFRAEQIERETGVPAINLALTAGLGVDYLLFLTRQVLEPGDVVIVAFEYLFYDKNETVTAGNAALALWNGSEWLKQLPLEQRILWLRNLSAETLAFGALAQIRKPRFTLPVGIIDARGDNIANTGFRLVVDGMPGAKFGTFHFDPEGTTTAALRSFFEWCRRHRVRYAAAWPTFNEALVRPDAFNAFTKTLTAFFADQGAVVLGTPADALLPGRLLVDGGWHTNAEGSTLRTRRLIRDLAEAGLAPAAAPQPR